MSTLTGNVVSKSEYARMRGVSRSMVSHWIKRRKLSDAALVNGGIDVDVADQQLRQRLEIFHRIARMGYGHTRLPHG